MRWGDLWVAREVASVSRGLDLAAVAVMDRAVSVAADTDQARERRERERGQRVMAIGRSDEHGLWTIFARVTAGDAVWVDAMLERVADALAARRGLVPGLAADCTRDELRAVGLG